MSVLTDITRSTIGKKLLNGLTGLLLCGFIVAHLVGNLLLLLGSEAFNTYAYTLHSLGHGALVPIAEVGLVILFGAHAASGISVALTVHMMRGMVSCVRTCGDEATESRGARRRSSPFAADPAISPRSPS